MSTCGICGRPTDEHQRDVRFVLPDPVLELPDRDDTEGVWKSEADPNRAVMMLVPNLGGFLRALLPVRLSGDHSVTFGVWVGVHPDDLKRAFDVWWAPEYEELRLTGRLANALPSWDVFGAPVDLAVTDAKQTPYCVSSSDAELHAVLMDEWDHEPVLSCLPR
jgi:hypothetical protein